jgi:hypothetical protein
VSGVAKAPLSISTVALVAVAGGVAMDMVILGAVVVPIGVGSGVAESDVASIVLMMSITISPAAVVLVGVGMIVAVGVIAVADTAVGLSSDGGGGDSVGGEDGVGDDTVVGDGSSTVAAGVALRAGTVLDGAIVGDAVKDGVAVGVAVTVGLGVAVTVGEGVAGGVVVVLVGRGAAGVAVGAMGCASPVSVTGVAVMPLVTLKGSVMSSAVGVLDGVGLVAAASISIDTVCGPAVARLSGDAVDGVGVAA